MLFIALLLRRSTSAFPERSVKLLLKPIMHDLNEDTALRSPDDVKASRITWLAAKMTVLSAVVPGATPRRGVQRSVYIWYPQTGQIYSF